MSASSWRRTATTGARRPPSPVSPTSSPTTPRPASPGLKSGKYDVITNLAPQDVEQAPKYVTGKGQEHPILLLDADDGITADINVRKALNLAVDKDALANDLFGGFASVDAGQLLSESILGYNDTLHAVRLRPRRGPSASSRRPASTAPPSSSSASPGRWLKDRELLEAIAGYWSAVGLDVQLEVLEFGAYLDVLFDRENRADSIYVSSSNDLLDPERQLATYYEAGGIGSSNTNSEMADLIAAGRTELDEEAQGDDVPGGREDRLRRGAVRLPREQRGHLRSRREPSSSSRGSTRSCSSRR
ncbi:MAG: ABC transporter substrate-binding protein [Ilumatobacteraceae bacterium]